MADQAEDVEEGTERTTGDAEGTEADMEGLPDQIIEDAEASFEGNLRATGQSAIEKTPQALALRELVAALNGPTERVGFEPTEP